jgi:hypothetical protein
MLTYIDAAAIAAAPTTAPVNGHLRQLLADRVYDWTVCELLDLTYLVIVEAGDTESDLLDAVGYSPLRNPTTSKTFGQAGFTPSFDWLKLNGEYWELIETVGNDGAAFVTFVPDREDTDPELRRLCRTYADEQACAGS